MNFSLGCKDYLEVDIPTDLRVEHSGKISERKEIEELSEASRNTIPLAVVLPAEIPCEVSKDALLCKWPYCFKGYCISLECELQHSWRLYLLCS